MCVCMRVRDPERPPSTYVASEDYVLAIHVAKAVSWHSSSESSKMSDRMVRVIWLL